MSKKKMVEFNSDEMMKRINAKVHGTKVVLFTRIANKTGKSVRTVRAWFKNGKMPAVDFEALNDYIGTGEPKQMNFSEVGFLDLKNEPDVKNKKFTASPLRLTPPVEKRFRCLCDFLDYDAGEMLDRIVTNYLNNAKGKFGGEDEI